MTLSNESGDTSGKDLRGAHAIVVGGSITGLLATRALTDHFRSVTLIERDHFPDGPDFRKGVPQMRHVHVLLKQGERIMAHYFPELLAELIAGGAHLIDMGGDLRWFNFGNWKTRFKSGVDFFCQSRGFLEMKIRERLAVLPGVRILDECEVAGYTLDAGGRIHGVKVHRPGAAEEHLEADLVVDASGSKTLIRDLSFGIPSGEHLLITGESGAGKTSMLRAIAGLWRSGSGRILRPPLSDIMVLPQRPYMILGSLLEQLRYPHAGEVSDETLLAVLKMVNLADLPDRIGGWDIEVKWGRRPA